MHHPRFAKRSRKQWAILVLLLAVLALCLFLFGYFKEKAPELPTPKQEQGVVVFPHRDPEPITRTYTLRSSVVGTVTREKIEVHEKEANGVFVRQFGKAEDGFDLIEYKNGSIRFDFGEMFLASSPLYGISAGETRAYAEDGTDMKVTLVAEANERLAVGNHRYETLRLHMDIPMQDGNLLEVRLWLDREGKLIRYTRGIEGTFELCWTLDESADGDEESPSMIASN